MTKPIKPNSSFIPVFQDCMVVVPNIVPILGLTIESESLAADRSKHLNALHLNSPINIITTREMSSNKPDISAKSTLMKNCH